MTFGNYADSVRQKVLIRIDGTEIGRVESCKYFGVIIDFRLNWANGIEYIRNKTKYLFYVFFKVKQITSIFVMRIMYYAFLHSIISYGIISKDSAYNNNLSLLQTMQNRLLDYVNKNWNRSCNMRRLFALKSIVYHYESLKNTFFNSKSVTTKKPIQNPLIIRL